MPYLFFDYSYIIFILPAIVASLIIQARLKSTYRKYSRVGNIRGITGAQAAQTVLNYYGIHDVIITEIHGTLSDHYDPRSKVISLSSDVYSKSSIAAIGIACHEAGHAAQHAQAYAPIKIRNTILPVCNIGSTLSMPLLFIGFLLGFEPLMWVGVGFFAFTAIFQFVTLPVEFNASNRAIKVIESNGLLSFEEKEGAQKVLKVAAMTYVAALAVSLAQLLRFVFMINRRRR